MHFLKNLSLMSLLQRVVDYLTVCVGFALGYWFYAHYLERQAPYPFVSYMLFAALSAFLFLVVLHSAKLYEREISLLNLVETRGLLWVWIISSMVTLTITFYVRPLDLSRVMVTASLLFSFVLLLLERAIFYRLHLSVHLRGFSNKRVLVYGAGVVGRQLLKRILHSPALGLLPVGVLDDNRELWGKSVRVPEIGTSHKGTRILGDLSVLESLVKEKGVSEIFLGMPSAASERIMEIVAAARRLGLKVSIVPHMYDSQMYHLQIEELGGIPVMREKKYRPSYVYLFLKRFFDLCFSFLILVALSPLFLVVAVLIRTDSPGPIIFRQQRIGRGGRPFTLYKFRTMFIESPAYAVNPLSSDDPRITKIGRWLRRTSIDELPQFFNVLKGDMSIVGPRPEMPFIVDDYDEIHRERLLVKPGITGIWQISAVRGEAIHANIEYDLFYIDNQSLLLDLIIVLKTILVAIRGVGAY